MNSVPLKCRCGEVQGTARNISPRSGTRVVCCCNDCQAFATYLHAGTQTLDQHGGTEVLQISQAQVTIERGHAQLRCLRLRKKGLLRWYTGCCNTPLANTIKASLPFAAIIHTFIDCENRTEVLGPVRAYIQTQHAIGTPDHPVVAKRFPLLLTGRMARKLVVGKMKGEHVPSVFFGDDGKPCVEPLVVNP